MKRQCIWSILPVLFLILSIPSSQAQMIANISENVETDFGTYYPYPAEFTPAISSFNLEPDFSNVENWSELFGFNSTDLILLQQNHFTVKRSQYTQMYDIYNLCTWNGTPIFVTTDAVLHIYHLLFDHFLTDIEIIKFIPELEILTKKLIEQSQIQYTNLEPSEAREAAYRNLAFLYVSQKLLKGAEISVPTFLTALVDSELTLIENHDGFHYSPIFGDFSALDYSQFIPRGHYTKNDSLKAYFKAMMWQGWTIFTMEPGKFGDLAYRHTLQALLLVQMLYTLETDDGQPLRELWEKIYEPTVFFVGKTDDPNIRDYRQIADTVYGPDFLTLSPDSLANKTLMNEFMSLAQQLPEPKIPNWIFGTFTTYKGFRLMGQRFIPDSYMFAHLVLPEVDGRLFPKGLDIMAILGSDRAYDLLDSLYEQTAYPNYAERIDRFQTEFRALSPAEWAQNLYWNWLYSLMPLLYEKGDGYPHFMQTIAWLDKELMTALASWAELRHDTILYAKQSMTPRKIAPGPPKSYVEPNPHLYARLASLVRFTRTGLESRNLMLPGFQDKLDLFDDLLLFLRDIAVKELENTPLSSDEYENIFCFGRLMQYLISDADDPFELWQTNTDEMAIVADVHTDSNTGMCLEEGVGYPLEIFVIVNEGGSIRLTKGAIFSYYEFKQPIGKRLTDEAWREMLAGETPPEMPEWVNSFMDVSATQPDLITESVDNLYYKEFQVVDEEPLNETLPKQFRLYHSYPNPFNASTTIRYDLPENARITLRILNLLGQEVKTLVNDIRTAGSYHLSWDGTDHNGNPLPSGVYIVQLQQRNKTLSHKILLLK